MQAYKMDTTDNRIADQLRALQRDGVTFAAVGVATGISRTAISQLVNKGLVLKPEQMAALQEYLDGKTEAAPAPAPTPEFQQQRFFKTEIELYETREYLEAIGWCKYLFHKRRMGVMVGYPGAGKTTVLKEFCKMNPDARYIDCWPTMIIGDLLKTIAASIGVTITGTKHERVMQLVNSLRNRTDVMLVFDEAENLRNWNVKNFDILRKIWDDTGTPVIFCGTPELENMLTRGGGRDNLAQLYRRKLELKLGGIAQEEVVAILRDYNITPDAANTLIKIALDAKHGGMGNFVEILDMALEAAAGGQVDKGIIKGAMQYKLLY